ncbi:MAG: diguanylate cyclase [Pelosinus sp.]|nr:diguanylate cyclase [Pelosinus sp.]
MRTFNWVSAFLGHWHLRQKLSMVFVLVTLLPILITNFLTWHSYQEVMRNLVVERNSNLAKEIASDINWMVIEKIRAFKIIGESQDIQSMDPARQAIVLKKIAQEYPDVQLAVISDAGGRQIARWDGKPADAGINYTDRKYYQQVIETGKTVISDVLIAKSTNKLGIVIATPIKGAKQELLGLLIINLELDKLIRHLGETKIGDTGYAYVVNSEGKIIIHPDSGLVVNGMDVSQLVPVKAATSGQTGWTEYEYNGQRRLAGFSCVPSTEWGVIAQQPLDEAMRPVTEVKKSGLLITVGAAIIAMCIGLIIAGALSRPIIDISQAANALARGELQGEIKVRAQDEIGQLAANFNNMVTQLVKRDEAIRESEGKYHSLVDNLSVGIYRATESLTDCFIQANPAMARIFQYNSVDEFLKVPLCLLFQNRADFKKLIGEIKQNGYVKNKEILIYRMDESVAWCSFTVTAQYTEQGSICWLDGVVEDISERKQGEELLRRAHDELESQVTERTRELVRLNEALKQTSLLDGLTGIANRRYFDEFFEREWQQAQTEKRPIAMIMLDVDFFKSYNDTYGHLAGDKCLQLIADVLKNVEKDVARLAARYGGEEFAIILPNTDWKQAASHGEKIRTQVENLGILHDQSAISPVVTVSLGVACMIPKKEAQGNELIIAADKALYMAKQAGRNCMQIAGI